MLGAATVCGGSVVGANAVVGDGAMVDGSVLLDGATIGPAPEWSVRWWASTPQSGAGCVVRGLRGRRSRAARCRPGARGRCARVARRRTPRPWHPVLLRRMTSASGTPADRWIFARRWAASGTAVPIPASGPGATRRSGGRRGPRRVPEPSTSWRDPSASDPAVRRGGAGVGCRGVLAARRCARAAGLARRPSRLRRGGPPGGPLTSTSGFPGLRVPRTRRVFEAAVSAVLSQKVTGREASASWQTLIRRYGTSAPGPVPRGLTVPPEPAAWRRLAPHDLMAAGVTPDRARTVQAVAVRRGVVRADAHRRSGLHRGRPGTAVGSRRGAVDLGGDPTTRTR